MAEFDDGLGEGEVGEGVLAIFLEEFGLGLFDGVGGVFEGEACDDEVGEGGAGDVDAGPVGVGA